MSRVSSFDGEIGRGRQKNEDDSSSSRESSPAPGPRRASKRSFSPLSDDGDVVIQNEDKDQTPPPAERPIIRQAVAFSDQASQVPVMTYEAEVLPPTTKHFLPGQVVPLPPKPKNTKKNRGVKRPRRPDAYPGQTSKFRLDTYDPTPTTAPPTTHGQGPYSSLYRNVGPGVQAKVVHQRPQAGPSNGESIGRLHRVLNTGSVNNSNAPWPSSGFNDVSNAAPSLSFLQTASAQRSQQISTTSNSTSSALHPPQSQSRTQSPSPRPLSTDTHSHSRFVTDTTLTIRERSSPGLYYRRNYDDKDFTPPPRDRRTISRTTSSKSSSPDTCYPGLTHVVTLLITDVRSHSGEPDHQLAEVKVPLKKADELEEGWWADARDIAEKLQMGAARIDGPAKVYTLRGKYRQFILRVTAENKDDIVSANVPVSAERTLDLTVEMLHPPGVPTRPRQSPRQWSKSYDNHTQRADERMDVDRNRAVFQSRKRRASPSFDDYDHSEHHRPTPTKIRRHDRGWSRSPRRRSPSLYGDRPFYTSRSDQESRFHRNSSPLMDRRQCRRSRSPQYRSHGSPSPPPPLARTPLPTVHVGPGYPHREEEEDSSESEEPFARAVERLLRGDLEATDEYYKAIAGNKVCDIVKQYEIVSRMFKKWVGKRPPGFSQPIEEIDVANALEIDDSQEFIHNCKETLDLLKLYGKRGRVVEDPRVVTMLDDQNPLPVNSDPARKLLRLLRDLDDAWKNDRSGPLLDGITLPEPSSGTFDKSGPYSPEPKSKPPGHNQMTTASPRQYQNPSSTTRGVGGRLSEETGSVGTRYSSRGKTLFVD